MTHIQERIRDINVSKDDFSKHLDSKFHREYIDNITFLVMNQTIFEDSWIKTKGGFETYKEKVLVYGLEGEISYTQAFKLIDKTIYEHNHKFYDPNSERGVQLDVVSKAHRSLGMYRGKIRSTCIVPFIEGIEKKAVEIFIKNIMGFEEIYSGLIQNPFTTPYVDKDTVYDILTFCNKEKGRYFYLDKSKYNMSVLLPDLNDGITTLRNIKTWGDIKRCPELELLSFMAYYLSKDSFGENIQEKPHKRISEKVEAYIPPEKKKL